MAGLTCLLAASRCQAGPHSFEYVAEHLPESAMNNRLATLPLWSGAEAPVGGWQTALQGAAARSQSGSLTLGGPMLSVTAGRPLGGGWTATLIGFADALRFSGGPEQRPLETLFARPPLALPAEALFTDLQGTYRSMGAGLAFTLKRDGGWLGEHQWVAGALAQRVQLRDYRATYLVLDGASSGASGSVDYSGDYDFVVPFAGFALVRRFGPWTVVPHVLLGQALPRRGLQGRITGPGFDLQGDTATAGNGKHVGDPSLTAGVDVDYVPWGLTLSVGTLFLQAWLEPAEHKGTDRNWVISVSKRF
jgi:hypothetical protein